MAADEQVMRGTKDYHKVGDLPEQFDPRFISDRGPTPGKFSLETYVTHTYLYVQSLCRTSWCYGHWVAFSRNEVIHVVIRDGHVVVCGADISDVEWSCVRRSTVWVRQTPRVLQKIAANQNTLALKIIYGLYTHQFKNNRACCSAKRHRSHLGTIIRNPSLNGRTRNDSNKYELPRPDLNPIRPCSAKLL